MADSGRHRAASWRRAKTVTFAGIALMTAYVLYHNERFLIDASDPNWTHIRPFRWWLLVHGLVGAPALLLAPLQFSNRLRQRFVGFHHVVGYIYVVGVFVLGPLGAYIQWFQERSGGPRSFTILGGVDAALLLTTTGIALYFALKRKITPHRQWMTRSYAVALVFFEGRMVLGVTGLESMGSEMVQAVIWTCLAFAFLFADIANQWSDFGSLRVPARQSATVKIPADAIGTLRELA
ncbi:MAG TPA: DUF2306 domain-containing protein [Vicinamibacterales bacterium]|jgi:hypothetical protein|nr:DUF2306 domain-containing protein [Vicinamibacterales bacterium]